MIFRDDHVLPTVRIQKIIVENFKSVRHGEIVFNCGRKKIPQDTEPDILGIYGQNGSGKTSVIEALAILKSVVSGFSVNNRYSECVMDGADYSMLSFVFDLQYPIREHEKIRTIYYSFKMGTVPNEIDDETSNSIPTYQNKVRIFDEEICASGWFAGENQKKQVILTSSGVKYPFGPTRKVQDYIGNKRDDAIVDLEVSKVTASKESRSFVFADETLKVFENYSNYSEYYQVLLELKYYAQFYLFAIDTRSSSSVGSVIIPFRTTRGMVPLDLMHSTRMSEPLYNDFCQFVERINIVLPTLIAGMELVVERSDYVSEKRTGKEVKLFSKRGNTIIPLRDESAGIIKLIGIMSLIIAAFNDRSITVAIDELDAGIYEYLLGELLIGMQSYGKGQFIFTSHNLRPLEVLKKEFLLFTTSNPDNRYIRLKGVGNSNNLRNLYLREIVSNTQDEEIYDAAKRQRMIASFLKAGVGYAKTK